PGARTSQLREKKRRRAFLRLDRAATPAPDGPADTRLRRLGAGRPLEAVLPLEALDASRGVHQLLLTGEERMARRADLDVDLGNRGTGLDDAAAGTDDARLLVPRMNAFLHGRGHHTSGVPGAQRASTRAWNARRPDRSDSAGRVSSRAPDWCRRRRRGSPRTCRSRSSHPWSPR